ncbi:sulfite exporter TauE/SafE family protein [Agromyces protaetiae]|uniref:Probable membrane transporter protein n=1 Tax=Agromyces protaetiae TaxID=2509455 RepID=A0A4P6FAX9_9MICO|nr:sulfite exporter TauE/SafE family protein [Agromyces protaetiae]QAY72855.1 sulfite exporter TauE/SafE family protein [Agromyces protaetiae]
MWLESLAIFAAGAWAGLINVIVGSGTLVTFPVLIMLGYPPLTANISSGIGLVAGSITGAVGFRREIAEQRSLALLLLPAGAAGGLAGGLLLLVLPPEAFSLIVPVLVGLGIVMVVVAPMLQRWIAKRRVAVVAAVTGATAVIEDGVPDVHEPGVPGAPGHDGLAGMNLRHRIVMIAAVFVLGLYGGYFGAALGVIMLGALSLLSTIELTKLNALKNLLIVGINGVSATLFIIVANEYISWRAVALLAIGATLGGLIGARIGRRIPDWVLRTTVVVVGTIALVNLIVNS